MNILLNDGQGADYTFKAGKRYRFRIINISALASAMIEFDSHDMNVIMNDAAYVEKESADQLRVAPAQRYDVIVEAKDRDYHNFPFLVSLDLNRDFTAPGASWALNSTGHLVMDPKGEKQPMVVDVWQPSDDSHFEPQDGCPLLSGPDKTFVFSFEPCTDANGIERWVIRPISSYRGRAERPRVRLTRAR